MSDGIKLIGYSSDCEKPLWAIKGRGTRKKEKDKRQSKIKQGINDDEWFVYNVDGEKWYFKVYKNANTDFIGHLNVSFLGIARANELPDKISKPIQINKPPHKSVKPVKNTCCYCEVTLIPSNNKEPASKTMDHIIPRHRGGKITKPCCYQCNQEKGGLMLHSYIQMLNLMMLQVTGDELLKLQTKIKNANRIAKEINSDN